MTSPAPATNCGRCGAKTSAEGLWGLCTKCLYSEASELQSGQPLPGGAARQFGDYEIGKILGRGGMGVVYEAVQVKLHRRVALKMILDSETESTALRRRFIFEAEVAAKLDHPNIVPIYEVGEHDGQLFLSMKIISGDNLRKRIASGESSLLSKDIDGSKTNARQRGIAIAELMAAISRAVHHAHENGVLHRDLKPANILMDREGRPHLTDFGLAKMMQAGPGEPSGAPLTLSGVTMGTPNYMSPEQAAAEPLSAASDVYSLGAILYEILTGKPPFQGASVMETLWMLAEQEAKPPRSLNPCVDRDLEVICLKCLEKDPSSRYGSAAALAADLQRWLAQEPIQARPASIALRTRRWVARNRVGSAFIVTLCAGLAVAIVLLQLTLARQRELKLHRSNSVQRFTRGIEEMWADRQRQSVLIPSSDLAELADLPPRQADVLTTRLTFGISITHEPLGQAVQFAPFLGELERRMERVLNRPVMIDLRLSKSATNFVRDIEGRTVDIQRMGALTYVLSRQASGHLEPLVQEISQREAVIFAKKNSGISNLVGVAGKRVAFGQTNSMISFWAKVHLARAGIHAVDLASWVHLTGAKPERNENPARPKGSEDRDSETQAHKQVIQEVFADDADVGEAARRNFELSRYRKQGLVELFAYPVTPQVYVTRRDLDAGILRALQQALVSFKTQTEIKLLAQLDNNLTITGFTAIKDSDLDNIRSAMTHEVAEFERGSLPLEARNPARQHASP